MPLKKQLKARYQRLSRTDKELVGASLVKVNMGVGLPDDLRRVAGFIRGTGLVAKQGELNEFIHYLHEDPENKKSKKVAGGTRTISEKEASPSDSMIQNLEEYDEDSEVTVKEHVEGVEKKKK